MDIHKRLASQAGLLSSYMLDNDLASVLTASKPFL
jgi:hypothetical protein